MKNEKVVAGRHEGTHSYSYTLINSSCCYKLIGLFLWKNIVVSIIILCFHFTFQLTTAGTSAFLIAKVFKYQVRNTKQKPCTLLSGFSIKSLANTVPRIEKKQSRIHFIFYFGKISNADNLPILWRIAFCVNLLNAGVTEYLFSTRSELDCVLAKMMQNC